MHKIDILNVNCDFMAKISRMISWTKHLAKRRGTKFLTQTGKMFYFHTEPFHKLLDRIFVRLEDYDANFTFPLVASTAKNHEDYVDYLKSYPYEIAIHGYKHVRYQYLDSNQMDNELKLAVNTFKELKIPYKGFRAPYNNYSQSTRQLLDKYNFLWDIGIGYQLEYRENHEMFNLMFENGKKSSYTCIPLNRWSDDLMIDKYHLNHRQIGKILINEMLKAKKTKGLVMFDLHPIRLGRKDYVDSLKIFLEYANKINAWVPSVTEAVEYWNKHNKWKNDAPVCCLLTGDIDNFTFWDYLRRF